MSITEITNALPVPQPTSQVERECPSIKKASKLSRFVIQHLHELYLFVSRPFLKTYSSIGGMDRAFKVEQHQFKNPAELYNSFSRLYDGQSYTYGTCTVRTYAVAKSLTEGNSYHHDPKARSLLCPVSFEEHYQQSFLPVGDPSLEELADGTVFILARPTEPKTHRMVDALFSTHATTSQISHYCNGIKIDGQLYVLENSPKRQNVFFEPLTTHNSRLTKKNLAGFNMALPVGSLHSSYQLSAPDS